MSLVTNVILTCSAGDGPDEDHTPHGIAAVKAWCEKQGQTGVALGWPKEVDEVSGGSKHLECGLWAWGANNFEEDTFLEVVRTAPWEDPEQVQVFIKRQEEYRFVMYTLTPERMWNLFAPEPREY